MSTEVIIAPSNHDEVTKCWSCISCCDVSCPCDRHLSFGEVNSPCTTPYRNRIDYFTNSKGEHKTNPHACFRHTIYSHRHQRALQHIKDLTTTSENQRHQTSQPISFEIFFSLPEMLDRYGNVIRTDGDQTQEQADRERAHDTPQRGEFYMNSGWTINDLEYREHVGQAGGPSPANDIVARDAEYAPYSSMYPNEPRMYNPTGRQYFQTRADELSIQSESRDASAPDQRVQPDATASRTATDRND
jgi:hypothetical protein